MDATADRDELVNFLRGRNVLCPLCAVNLRDHSQSRCPKCKREICLTVGLAEPHARSWAAMTAPLCAMAGIGAWVLIMIFRQGWPERESTVFQASVALFLAAMPLLAAVVIKRKWIMRLGRGTQSILAAAAIALLIASVAMFFLGIRI